MTCEIDPASDLAWCRDGARNLMAGKTYIERDDSRPFVNRGMNNLRFGEAPAEKTSGEIPWAAEGFIITMPDHLAVTKYFRSDNGRAEYEGLLASALLHELVHFRQYRHPEHAGAVAPDKLADTQPETLLPHYYSDPRELEAHAAQIAFLLGPARSDEPTHAAAVFAGNLVGQRIGSRLDTLRGGSMAGEYEGFRARLTAAVAEWRDRLFPAQPLS